jgi:GNAT superfamily N-acetyltransferase
LDGEEWAGTVTWYRPDPDHPVVAYRDPVVAHFGQLGVVPKHRGRGLGKALVDHVVDRAKESGFGRLALDTAEPASGLLDLYSRWGFEVVGEHDWRPGVNYRSLVLAKTL